MQQGRVLAPKDDEVPARRADDKPGDEGSPAGARVIEAVPIAPIDARDDVQHVPHSEGHDAREHLLPTGE